jgi:hypothetical protein
MSAIAVEMKTPAATAMAGAKTNNNLQKAACPHGHAAPKLLPPSCHRHCQAARHCRTAAAIAALPLPLPWQCCRQATAAAAMLLPSCAVAAKLLVAVKLPLLLLRCHCYRRGCTTAKLLLPSCCCCPQAACHFRTAAAAAALPLRQQWQCCRQAAAAAAALPPSCCHHCQAACRS